MKPARWMPAVLLFVSAAFPLHAQENEGAKMLVVPPVQARDIEGGGMVTNAVAPPEAPGEPELQKQEGEGQPAGDKPPGEPVAGEAAADDVIAPAFPVSRYAVLWERSPFQLESIAPPEVSAGLAQQYALTGIAEINNEPIVFLLERTTQLRHMLDKKTNTAGLSLVQIDMKEKYGDSTAVIRKGAEVGVVKFEPTTALPSTPSAPVPQQGGRVMRGAQQPGAPQASIPGQSAGGQGISAPMPGANPGQVSQGAAGAVPGVVPAVPGPAPDSGNQAQGQQAQGQQPQVGNQTPGTSQGAAPPRVIRRRALIPAAP